MKSLTLKMTNGQTSILSLVVWSYTFVSCLTHLYRSECLGDSLRLQVSYGHGCCYIWSLIQICVVVIDLTYPGHIGAPSQEKRIQKLAERVRELPVANYYTLKALIEHLRRWEFNNCSSDSDLITSLPSNAHIIRVVEMGHVNKMMATNCAIVFGPTIMRAEADSLEMATLMPIQNGITEMFINEFVSIFQK